MKRALLAFTVLLGASGAIAQEDARLQASRDLAARLQSELGARLMAAIGAGGPASAIDVCNVEAPGIAATLSEQAGARVSRTALRLRNVANAPDDAARSVLEQFELAVKAGAEAPPELFEAHADGSARYMRAIITQPLCLTCHGAQIAADVKTAIEQRYPTDEATGFAVGDLRGAFLIEWPAAAASTTPPAGNP